MRIRILDISDHTRLYVLCGSLGWLINKGDGVASALIGASLTMSAFSFWEEWLEQKAQKARMAEFEKMMSEMGVNLKDMAEK